MDPKEQKDERIPEQKEVPPQTQTKAQQPMAVPQKKMERVVIDPDLNQMKMIYCLGGLALIFYGLSQ